MPGLDVADPHRQQVAAPIQGRHAAVLAEGVREDIFVQEAESLQAQLWRYRLGWEEVSPEEVHHIPVQRLT